MNILIDIGHPAHVHLFRNFTQIMQQKGHNILFTCRQKEFEIELLKASKFNFKCFGKHYKTKIGKIWGLFRFDWQMLVTSLQFKPDLFFSHGSFYAAQVAWLLRKPHISMEDTGNREQMRLYLTFTKAVLVPDILNCNIGQKQISFCGYNELAYLHPNRFIKEGMGYSLLEIEDGTPYFILRFVAWNASHDYGQTGLSGHDKIQLVNLLNKNGRVFITSENELPPELEPFKIRIYPENIHQVLANATMVISEGATMASEAALLGVKSIYVNSLAATNVIDEEKYGISYVVKEEDNILNIVQRFLDDPNLKYKTVNNLQKLLQNKIDVTSFMVFFIENWPKSFEIMKENPDYQNNFK